MNDATHYRPGIGIALVNRQGLVFVGHRRDHRDSPWQMPQGGLATGEAPEAAANRELREELGTSRAQILDLFPDWLRYDYPRDFRSGRAKRFRGQQHLWFLMGFTGEDADIAVATAHPEFDQWRWVHAERAIELAVPFKRPIYREVLAYFAPAIARFKRAAPWHREPCAPPSDGARPPSPAASPRDSTAEPFPGCAFN